MLAVLAVILLPALRAQAPLVTAREWTVGQLGAEAVHAVRAQPKPGQPSLRDIVRQAQTLARLFGGGKTSPELQRALTLGALVPLAAIVAGLCALLSLLWLGLRWRWVYLADAIAGLAACAYAIVASRALTHVAQADLTRAQQGLPGLLHRFGLKIDAPAPLAIGLVPEIGLYVIGVLFIAMLLLPLPHQR